LIESVTVWQCACACACACECWMMFWSWMRPLFIPCSRASKRYVIDTCHPRDGLGTNSHHSSCKPCLTLF
jgi:hypothetical protein